MKDKAEIEDDKINDEVDTDVEEEDDKFEYVQVKVVVES